jgi:protein-tyrosine phosphatase
MPCCFAILYIMIAAAYILYKEWFAPVSLDHIIDNIYLGSWIDSTDIRKLKKYKIKGILTFNKEFNHSEKDKANFQKLGIPKENIVYYEVFDGPNDDIIQYAEDAIKKIKSINGNVLVHCTVGMSRSASIVIAYLIKEKNMTYEEALTFVKKKKTYYTTKYFLSASIDRI